MISDNDDFASSPCWKSPETDTDFYYALTDMAYAQGSSDDTNPNSGISIFISNIHFLL